MSSLFRSEAIEAQRAKWIGGVSLAQPLKLWWLAGFVMLAAILVIALLTFGEYTRRTRVSGQLVPSSGLVTMTAPVGGLLTQVEVKEGERVQRGTLLAQVDVPTATSSAASVIGEIGSRIAERAEAIEGSYSAQLQQLESREVGLREQVAALMAQVAAVEEEKRIRTRQAALGEGELRRFRALREEHYVTAAQLQQQEILALEHRASLQSLEGDLAGLVRQLATLNQSLSELTAMRQALESDRRREGATLGQESIETAARGNALIHAPVNGVVTALLGLPGQPVQAGQALLTVLPDGSALEAHLLVPSRAIGFIAPGDSVLLRYQAFPYQKFGQGRGRVLRVSRSALTGAELTSLSMGGGSTEPMYRVVVQLDKQGVLAFGKQEPLRPGMLLEADVMGDRRRLLEWLFEPLFSVLGKM